MNLHFIFCCLLFDFCRDNFDACDLKAHADDGSGASTMREAASSIARQESHCLTNSLSNIQASYFWEEDPVSNVSPALGAMQKHICIHVRAVVDRKE